MSLDLRGLLPLSLPLPRPDALELDLPTPPRLRGLNMRRRPERVPPDDERESDASEEEAPSSPPLFSRWNPRGERIRGERTLDRLLLASLFFLDDDGGGGGDEEAIRPGRVGISNGEGAGPSAGTALPPPLAVAVALRNFMVGLGVCQTKV